MGDVNTRRPVASRFVHGVDFGLIVHRSPFMADEKDPMVLSNYLFELLEVNPGVVGFLIQLRPEDVDAVVESVTAHAEKGAGTKTTLYVGHQEEEEVEEVVEVGAGRGKDKPHSPLMISVQKVRIRLRKGKGSRMVASPNPSPTTLAGSAQRTPKPSSPCTPFAPQRRGSVSGMGSPLPTLFRGRGSLFFLLGQHPPLLGRRRRWLMPSPWGPLIGTPTTLCSLWGEGWCSTTSWSTIF